VRLSFGSLLQGSKGSLLLLMWPLCKVPVDKWHHQPVYPVINNILVLFNVGSTRVQHMLQHYAPVCCIVSSKLNNSLTCVYRLPPQVFADMHCLSTFAPLLLLLLLLLPLYCYYCCRWCCCCCCRC
jgi:hypothetical protein